MTRRLALLALLAVLAPSSAGAAPRTGAAARMHGHTAVHAAAPGPLARPGGGPRTLEDIHIEGEIPVPQVLFVTAREQRRFVEFQHRRYLRTGRQLAAATPLPDWITVSRPPVTLSQETPR